MNQQQYKMMKVLQKVTIFKGFDVSEAEHLLQRCFLQTYEVGQEIYRADEASEEMLILLNGQLAVTSKAGKGLGEVVAGTSTGEMGFFTGEPRSANVTATAQSTGLVLRKSVLQALLQEDNKIHVKVLRNVLVLLSKRLADASMQIEDYSKQIQEMEYEMESLRRQSVEPAEVSEDSIEPSDGTDEGAETSEESNEGSEALEGTSEEAEETAA